VRISILLSVFVLGTAAPAAAQLTVARIPWGTPAAQVRARLEAQGWRFRGVDQDGDQVFGGPRGSEAVATLAAGGLVGMELRWPATRAAARARYRAATDSLRRGLGAHTTVDEESTAWSRGDTLLYTSIADGRGARPEPAAGITGWGPGYHAEMERRSDLERARRDSVEAGTLRRDPLLRGDWTRVYSDARVLTRLDSAGARRVGPGRYRIRVREDWMFTRRLANGMMYNAAVREMELDCRAPRVRVLRTTPAFADRSVAGAPLAGAGGVPSAWEAPAPGSPEARAIRGSCGRLGGA